MPENIKSDVMTGECSLVCCGGYSRGGIPESVRAH